MLFLPPFGANLAPVLFIILALEKRFLTLSFLTSLFLPFSTSIIIKVLTKHSQTGNSNGREAKKKRFEPSCASVPTVNLIFKFTFEKENSSLVSEIEKKAVAEDVRN